jgi:hypothetical protein
LLLLAAPAETTIKALLNETLTKNALRLSFRLPDQQSVPLGQGTLREPFVLRDEDCFWIARDPSKHIHRREDRRLDLRHIAPAAVYARFDPG